MEGFDGGTLMLETAFIFLLILINGFFAGSEVAVISLRRSRVQELAETGDGRAATVQRLKNDPERFLATIQIGINFVGTLASAVGGALAVRTVHPLLDRLPGGGLRVGGEMVALGIVVLTITYLTVVFGELVPKSLALRHAERVALAIAGPLEILSRWFSFLARPLIASSRLILSPFGVAPHGTTGFVSEEEIMQMVREGKEKGIFDQAEQELIHSVFEFTESSVKKVMVPRPRRDHPSSLFRPGDNAGQPAPEGAAAAADVDGDRGGRAWRRGRARDHGGSYRGDRRGDPRRVRYRR